MSDQNSRDKLFCDLIKDLTADVMSDTKRASDETIHLSAKFLDSESQSLVENFNELEHGHCDQLDDVKEGVQEVIRKDRAVRAEINVILSAMQFAELLRQHLDGLTGSFEILTCSDRSSVEQLKEKMLSKMHTLDERKAFYRHVMHDTLSIDDEATTQELIDQLIG